MLTIITSFAGVRKEAATTLKAVKCVGATAAIYTRIWYTSILV